MSLVLFVVQGLLRAVVDGVCPNDVAGNRVGDGVGDVEVAEFAQDIVHERRIVRCPCLLRIGVVDKAYRDARFRVGSRGDLVRSDLIDTANVCRSVFGGIVDGGDGGCCYRTEQ